MRCWLFICCPCEWKCCCEVFRDLCKLLILCLERVVWVVPDSPTEDSHTFTVSLKRLTMQTIASRPQNQLLRRRMLFSTAAQSTAIYPQIVAEAGVSTTAQVTAYHQQSAEETRISNIALSTACPEQVAPEA